VICHQICQVSVRRSSRFAGFYPASSEGDMVFP
jgi:hypothetical protein